MLIEVGNAIRITGNDGKAYDLLLLTNGGGLVVMAPGEEPTTHRQMGVSVDILKERLVATTNYVRIEVK